MVHFARSSRLAGSAVAVLGMVFVQELHAQTVLDLGLNTSGQPLFSSVNAINPDGSFAVGTNTFSNTTRAFRWTLTGGNGDISCDYTSGANALANVSIIAGFAHVAGGPIPIAAQWMPSSCATWLSPTPPGVLRSVANAINLNATLIVGADTFNNPMVGDYTRPWQWTPTGGFQPLPIPLIYGAAGVARAISSNGLVIVGDSGSQDYIPGYLSQPCTWIGGVQTQLGLLTPNSSRAQATATNADGTVIVGGGDIAVSGFPFPSPGPWHAFRWQGAYQDLGLLPNAPSNGYTYARAVSEDGSVVLGHGTDASGQHAFIWREDFGMLRLDTLLNFLNVDTTGWTFREANDISANDRAIGGGGVKDGLARAYVVRNLPRLCGPLVTGQAGPVINVCQGENVSLWTTGFWGPLRPSMVWRKQVPGRPPRFEPIAEGETPWSSYIQSPDADFCTILNAQPQDSGFYDCIITAGCDSVVLQSIAVNVLTGPQMVVPVQLTQQVCKGATATFSVTVVPGTAGGPLTYQWNKNLVPLTDGVSCGSTISGAQSSTLTITNCAGADAAVYGVTVSGPCGTLVSAGQLLVCVADVDDGSSTGTCDGGVTIDDLLYFLYLIEIGDPAADIDDGNQTGQPDCGVTIDDLLYYLPLFESGCGF